MDPVELFNEVLKLAVEANSSDVVVKSSKPAYFRISGRLKQVDMDPIEGEVVRGFVAATVPRNLRGAWERDGGLSANVTTWECERAPTVIDLDPDARSVVRVAVPPRGS